MRTNRRGATCTQTSKTPKSQHNNFGSFISFISTIIPDRAPPNLVDMNRFAQTSMTVVLIYLQHAMVAEAEDNKSGVPGTTDSHSQHSRRSPILGSFAIGSSKSFLSKLLLTREEASLIWGTIKRTTHWEDVLLIALAGWLVVPLVSIPYNNLAYLYDFSY